MMAAKVENEKGNQGYDVKMRADDLLMPSRGGGALRSCAAALSVCVLSVS